MKRKNFFSKTRTAEEVNRHIANERERLSGGMFGSKLLPQPTGNVPSLSPATPGGTFAMRSQGDKSRGVIDR